MALSGRELLLILRARDEATRTIDRVSRSMRTLHNGEVRQISEETKAARERGRAMMASGAAAVGMGASMAFAGAVGVRAMFNLTKSTGEYDTQARRTLTQVDKLHPSLQRIEKMGIQVGNTVPAAFDQMQSSLYDIFSSIDVGYSGAHKLLNQFARDAVGGNADIATATKANLAIMNSYGIGVRHVTRVSDFMFQLVRKGVGTYDDFAQSIGLILPSAVRLGVNLNQVGASLAFMTRNGLSASRAATSGARAFDALSNPRTQTNLKKMGINILDAQHNLLPMPVILDKMNKKMKDMNNFQKSTFLKDAFYGSGGTIQALRFFNMVFKHMDKFHKYIGDMNNSQGTAAKAFDTMSHSYQAQLQMLSNKWHILRVELGTYLLPVVLKLVQAGIKLVDWFRSLSPEMQKTIVIAGAISAVLLTIGGVITVLVGSGMMLVGAFKMLDVTAGEFASKATTVAAGLALMAGGMVMAYTATDKTHKAIGILASTMGGATAGSVFGPWGVAIGGVVGAIGGFIAAMHNAHGAAKTVAADYSGLASTLDTLTGATTQATRAYVYDQLQRSGTIKSLATYGIAARTAVGAVMGETKARKEVSAAIHGQELNYKSLTDQIKKLKAANAAAGPTGSTKGYVPSQEVQARTKEINTLQAEADAEKKVIDAVRSGTGIVKASVHLARLRAQATQDLTGKLKGIPNRIKTYLQLNGVNPTVKGIARVRQQFHLTPKQVKTLITATGVNTTVKQVKKVADSMKNVARVKPNFNEYNNSLRAGSHTAAGLARDMGTTTAQNMQAGPAKSKANLRLFIATLRSGLTQAKNTASTGGQGVGNALSSGVISGFSGTAATLSANAADAVNQAIIAARAAAQARSPSRRMYQLGLDMSDGLKFGFQDGMGGGRKHAHHTMQQWIDSISKANIKLRAKNLVKDLENAQAKLKKILDQQRQFESAVRTNVTDFGSLANISAPTDVFGNTGKQSLGNIKSTLRSRLKTIWKFKRLLHRLLKAGYSNNIYRQVALMGPETGVPYAQALLDATPKQVRQINNMNADIHNAADNIASTTGKKLYRAGIKAAQGLVDGLKKKKKALIKAARDMGLAIVKEIAKILSTNELNKLIKQMEKAAAKRKKHHQATTSGSGRGMSVAPVRHHTTHHHHNTWNVRTSKDNATATARKLAWEYEKRFLPV